MVVDTLCTLLELATDVEEAYALTAKLVSRRSYPGEEEAVQLDVADWFRSIALEPELQPTENHRPNLIVRVKNGSGPTLMINGHVYPEADRTPEIRYRQPRLLYWNVGNGRFKDLSAQASDIADKAAAEKASAVMAEAEEARERARLDAGEKQVVLWNSRS